MAISKKIAGFDDTQADSITRKIIAKKKQSLWPMLIRCHIYGKKNCKGPKGWENNDNLPWYDPDGKYGDEIKGAISNGYTVQEVLNFFESIESYANYCFNKSHAASYSLIGLMTAWLKYYYPTEFWAAVMTVTEDSKIQKYINIVRDNNIDILPPDINTSGKNFTPSDKSILFGLGKMKGLGEVTINCILAERQKGLFSGIEDASNRLPKKIVNKKYMLVLIKGGAFDSFYSNRLALINRFFDARNDKKAVRFNEEEWCPTLCQEMEEEILGQSITYLKYWDTVPNGKNLEDVTVTVRSVTERLDKNNHTMGFFELLIQDSKVSALMFSSNYLQKGGTSIKKGKKFLISGRKSNDKLVISKAQPIKPE